ncbi:hypothetical protein CRG98_049686 [Punica granatum]|uniref:Uncharacterized protein n=1 Tax=Punica granatum TaxID=22663 RepID=A0A2I0H519_PUNGR|nr:hypothetical protein CRG98_049686 [Punica granatum]
MSGRRGESRRRKAGWEGEGLEETGSLPMGWVSARGPKSGLPSTRVWAESGIAESARFRDSAIQRPIQARFNIL